jgi:hypothetical protein
VKKILGVSIKNSATDTQFLKLNEKTLSILDNDVAYYLDNQPNSEPFFITADKSIFVYPDPTESVTG